MKEVSEADEKVSESDGKVSEFYGKVSESYETVSESDFVRPKGIQSSISPGRSCRIVKPPWPCCDDGFYKSHR